MKIVADGSGGAFAVTPVQVDVSKRFRGEASGRTSLYVASEVSEFAGTAFGPLKTVDGPTEAYFFTTDYKGYEIIMGGGLVWRDGSKFKNDGAYKPGTADTAIEADIAGFATAVPQSCPDYRAPIGPYPDGGANYSDAGTAADGG